MKLKDYSLGAMKIFLGNHVVIYLILELLKQAKLMSAAMMWAGPKLEKLQKPSKTYVEFEPLQEIFTGHHTVANA